jgi:hypothetical protein
MTVWDVQPKNFNPKKPGLETGSNVPSLFLKQQTRSAELLGEHEIDTRQAKVVAATAERRQRELSRRPAQMDLEAENSGIRVIGGDGEDVMSKDEEELTEPNVMGTGMSSEYVTRMI